MQDEDGSERERECDSAFRRRAQSEVVRHSHAAKWKFVAAFSNLRRSWESGERERDRERIPQSPPSSSVTPPVSTPTRSAADIPVSPQSPPTSPEPARRRKRVSLFLRRRGRFREGNVAQSAYVGDAAVAAAAGAIPPGENSVHFRRAQSHFVKPVSYEGTTSGAGGAGGGEGGRYLRYAAEFDPEDFEKKRKALRKLRPAAIRLAPPTPALVSTHDPDPPLPKRAASSSAATTGAGAPGTSVRALAERFGGMNSGAVGGGSNGDSGIGVGVHTRGSANDGAHEGEGEIFGEICLEDFADDGSEDFEFLDGQIVDVWPEAVRLDGQAISLAGEEEFAAFCKEVGLHQLLKPPEPSPQDWSTFDVGDEIYSQWREDARTHNELLKDWKSHDIDAGIELRSLILRRGRRPP